MERKPRYDVKRELVADPESILAQGLLKTLSKPATRTFTRDELEFLFNVSAPPQAENWLMSAKLLRRKESLVFKLHGDKYMTKLTVTRR